MIAGVAGGIAEYLNVDPTIVRLITVGLFIVSFGALTLLYIFAWLIMPEAPD